MTAVPTVSHEAPHPSIAAIYKSVWSSVEEHNLLTSLHPDDPFIIVLL